MPKMDTSVYKGFLRSLEEAMQKKYFITLHFFRDPTIRGYVTEIDKEVYVAVIESEEGNCSQIRLNQITSLMWKKNNNEEHNGKEEKTKNQRKNRAIAKENRKKMEEESFIEYAKNHPTEADKNFNKETLTGEVKND